jgi:outer membrane protein OmpU
MKFNSEGKLMKNVLFATTALVATAGMAAAEINFSGFARFGVTYVEDRQIAVLPAGTVEDSEFNLEHRLRINIDASTQTDSGIEFGGRFRIQADENGENQNQGTINGARLHAEVGGFRLEVGNASHALDNLANFYGFEPGLTGAIGQYNGFQGSVSGFSSTGTGNNVVSAIYNVGDFRGQISYDGDSDGTGTDAETTSISVAYTFSGWTVALGYETADNGVTDVDGTVLTVGGTIGSVDLAFFLGDDDVGDSSYGVSGKFGVGAATDILFAIADGDNVSDTAVSVGFNHGLGGDVNLRGMIGSNTSGNTVADLGIAFNF